MSAEFWLGFFAFPATLLVVVLVWGTWAAAVDKAARRQIRENRYRAMGRRTRRSW